MWLDPAGKEKLGEKVKIELLRKGQNENHDTYWKPHPSEKTPEEAEATGKNTYGEVAAVGLSFIVCCHWAEATREHTRENKRNY